MRLIANVWWGISLSVSPEELNLFRNQLKQHSSISRTRDETMDERLFEIILETIKILLPVFSVLLAASAILKTLERGRRELAVKLINDWANDSDWATNRSITIATLIPSAALNDINDKKEALVPKDFLTAFHSILKNDFSKVELPKLEDDSSTDSKLSMEQRAFIKHLWVRWLNRLEGILAAWQQGAASQDIMRIEFEPLVKSQIAELDRLERVRQGLPINEEFVRQVKTTNTIDIKPSLGIFPGS